MSTNRRDFLKTSIAASSALGLGLGLGPNRVSASQGRPVVKETQGSIPPSPSRALDILILGGTNLTGPHHVRYALERGHSVTIFTRGQTQPGLFQDVFEHVEHLIGDREDNLEALEGRTWDAVIDASGMNVKWTTDSAELLKDSVETYLYVSSTGVYFPYLTTEIEEDTELVLEDPTDGQDVAYSYGVMKALSEIEAKRVFGDRALIMRPGYIVGPLDKTHRGTYWPDRLARGGEVMVPGKKTDLVQQIDVRDLTEFNIHSLENGIHGTFNITGPASPMTLEEFVYGMRAATSSEVGWTWIEDYDFLVENQVFYAIPWIIPLGDNLGSQRINIDGAKAAGLTFRPIAQTTMETLDWYYSDALTDEERATPPMVITAEKEAQVLAAWKARAG
jgi:2'-hydroxyisoflavone reductase